MSSLLVSVGTLKSVAVLPVSAPHVEDILVRPAADLAFLRSCRSTPRMHANHFIHHSGSAPQTNLDTLPVEVFSQILSYLVHPRSRIPGLTEAQSDRGFCRKARRAIKEREDLTTACEGDPWATDLFTISFTAHPFHALSLTSKRCHELVESYCGHLIRTCNPFNLPFAHFDKHGSGSVWPDLSGIVYRRLWLQHAPRKCVYCGAVIDQYPFPTLKRLITTCGDCFYNLALDLEEIERQFHLSAATIVASPAIRGNRSSVFYLRTDVEAIALQLYGTRAFHGKQPEQESKPCSICAITRFCPGYLSNRPRSNQKSERRLAAQKKRSRRFVRTA